MLFHFYYDIILKRDKRKEVYNMARVCEITGKRPMSGNNRSHSLRATRRKWGVNLQKVTVMVDGKPVNMRVSARALKTLKGKAA